ncbi:MAG TPA: hypothetical protein VMR97_03605 [Acidimicrobiales bacterium]|nr:hypothetical protein [Acidimicrobiales bacterium]
MIVRILGEGRYEVPDADMGGVERLDTKLVEAMDKGDEKSFAETLVKLVGEVRRTGKLLAPDDLRTSELAVPHEGSTLGEVSALLAEGGS